MKIKSNFVLYYRKSQRLSLSSSAETKTINDAIRWVLIAPPNHPNKMKRAIELIKKNKNLSKKIAKNIENDGLPIDSAWEEYLK